jgi:hypothetical protein
MLVFYFCSTREVIIDLRVINMVKLRTRLINNTDKELSIYEESSNGALTRVALLRPKHVPTTTPTINYESENSRSNQELPNSYLYSVDPNDSDATIRIWCGKQAVLSVSCEEVIDNSTITIEFKDGGTLDCFKFHNTSIS